MGEGTLAFVLLLHSGLRAGRSQMPHLSVIRVKSPLVARMYICNTARNRSVLPITPLRAR